MVREVSRREPHAPRPSYHTMSPYVQRAIHGTPPPPSTPRRRWPSTPAQASPLHLKVAYASPRAMASQTSNAADAEESDTIPPRSNTWQDRYVLHVSPNRSMEQLPSMAMAYLQGWWMDLASFLHQTSMGLPMGLLLHALSLLSQVMLPDSSFSLRAASRPSHRASLLFASKRRDADMHGQHAYSARLGHMILAQRVAALQFTVRLFFANCSLACCPWSFSCWPSAMRTFSSASAGRTDFGTAMSVVPYATRTLPWKHHLRTQRLGSHGANGRSTYAHA